MGNYEQGSLEESLCTGQSYLTGSSDEPEKDGEEIYSAVVYAAKILRNDEYTDDHLGIILDRGVSELGLDKLLEFPEGLVELFQSNDWMMDELNEAND